MLERLLSTEMVLSVLMLALWVVAWLDEILHYCKAALKKLWGP